MVQTITERSGVRRRSFSPGTLEISPPRGNRLAERRGGLRVRLPRKAHNSPTLGLCKAGEGNSALSLAPLAPLHSSEVSRRATRVLSLRFSPGLPECWPKPNPNRPRIELDRTTDDYPPARERVQRSPVCFSVLAPSCPGAGAKGGQLTLLLLILRAVQQQAQRRLLKPRPIILLTRPRPCAQQQPAPAGRRSCARSPPEASCRKKRRRSHTRLSDNKLSLNTSVG